MIFFSNRSYNGVCRIVAPISIAAIEFPNNGAACPIFNAAQVEMTNNTIVSIFF